MSLKSKFLRAMLLLAASVLVVSLVAACGGDDDDGVEGEPDPVADPTPGADPEPDPTAGGSEDLGGDLVIYSGRREPLFEPVVEAFEEATGIDVSVKYGATTELGNALIDPLLANHRATQAASHAHARADIRRLASLTEAGLS